MQWSTARWFDRKISRLFKHLDNSIFPLHWRATSDANSTPHRAHLSRANTRTVSRVHVAQVLEPSSRQDRWLVVLASLFSHPSHQCFTCTLLDPQLSPNFSTPFPTVAPGSSTTPSLLYPSASPSTATLQGRLCLADCLNNPPLTDYEPKSLIEVSSEHTPNNLPSGKGSLDTNLDDLATSVDASEIHDTTDVGRLASPLLSQKREVSAIPFSVSCSQTRSSVGRPTRDVEPFSSVEKPWSKGKRNRELESVRGSQVERERILSDRNIHDRP